MPPKRNPISGWALDLKGPRYLAQVSLSNLSPYFSSPFPSLTSLSCHLATSAQGCADPTPVACRWCAVTGLGPLPVPSIAVWSKEAEEAATPA